MTQVFRVSKPGIDVTSGTIPNNFYLTTEYPLFKVHAFGTFSITSGTTITHNLGYYPFVLTFSQFVDNNAGFASITPEYYQHDWYIKGATQFWEGWTKIYDDKIEINVGQSNAPLMGTQRVAGFYYIFKDPIV